VLREFVTSVALEDKHAILEREQALLASDSALQTLIDLTNRARGQGDEFRIGMLLVHTLVLTDLREHGLQASWSKYAPALAELYLGRLPEMLRPYITALAHADTASSGAEGQRIPASGVTADVTPRLDPSMRPLYEQIQALTQPQELPEQVALLREAIRRIDAGEGNRLARAEMESQLGMALAQTPAGDRAQNMEDGIAACKAALEVYTRQSQPMAWATTMLVLAACYSQRIHGEHAENVERAIACLEEVLQVTTREASPKEWAAAQVNLGIAYVDRVRGDSEQNLERAIHHLTASLEMYTRETAPESWATAQHNLGTAFISRISGDRAENIERAIACFEAALHIRTLAASPVEWAYTQNSLGSGYYHRVNGDRADNLERAIQAYGHALEIFTRDAFPFQWRDVQHNLATAYYDRIRGDHMQNLELAVQAYTVVLQATPLEIYPAQHRETALYIAETEADRGIWDRADAASRSAEAAERLLLDLGSGAHGRDAILKGGRETGTRHGFVLARLGQLDAAATAIERGRAQGLAEARALSEADPERITDLSRRQRFAEAQSTLLDAQASLNQQGGAEPAFFDPGTLLGDLDSSLSAAIAARRQAEIQRSEAFHAAQQRFDAIIDEIRRAQDPADFLGAESDAAAILRAAGVAGDGHALVYLLSTPWGGLALAALAPNSVRSAAARFAVLDLPGLTGDFVDDLNQTWLDSTKRRIIGGFSHATQDNGLGAIMMGRLESTFAAAASELHTACIDVGKSSTLDAAAVEVLQIPAVRELASRQVGALSLSELLSLRATVGHAFLQHELCRCLGRIADVALRPLAAWLGEQGVTSLTLVPATWLAALPLAAAPIEGELNTPSEWRTLSDHFPMSVAPNARSILRVERSLPERAGIYAMGDPRPTHQELPWSEAEALTLAALAGAAGRAVTGEDATRAWLVDALQRAQVVDASCHGEFDTADFLRSRLLLAHGDSLTLGDAISAEADLEGLRLLILSACQTAILDLRGARDEVRSLAASMVQAGARAVLAALWSVDDRATYLLMVRFAQEWFPRRAMEPPAAAFARAQRWLRTITATELRQWQAATPTLSPEARPATETDGALVGVSKNGLIAVRGRGDRYSAEGAESRIQAVADLQQPSYRPFTDPIYWAAFQITGW
jgi:CHAT domain-containing protein/tetratricopeptide (TPR) repeat protein